MIHAQQIVDEEPLSSAALSEQIRAMAYPLRWPEDLDPLVEHIGAARYVLLGEASHGTSEYYTWRTEISRRLIVEKGFSFIASYQGSVIAGRHWEAPMERMTVPPAREGSWEDLLHSAGVDDKLLLLATAKPTRELLQPRGHRAIGVVYRPEYERYGNYVPTVLPRRYDAFIYLDESEAVHPLHEVKPRTEGDAPETYPWGV